jgi:hypothetical protein
VSWCSSSILGSHRSAKQQMAGVQRPQVTASLDLFCGRFGTSPSFICVSPCREAKYLQLIGVHVPEAARTLLLQEEKFNYYFSQLSFSVSRTSLCR